MPQKRMECFRLLFDHLAGIEHQFLSGIRDSKEDFHGASPNFLERHTKCIAAGGEYFEGDLSFMCTINKSAHTKKV